MRYPLEQFPAHSGGAVSVEWRTSLRPDTTYRYQKKALSGLPKLNDVGAGDVELRRQSHLIHTAIPDQRAVRHAERNGDEALALDYRALRDAQLMDGGSKMTGMQICQGIYMIGVGTAFAAATTSAGGAAGQASEEAAGEELRQFEEREAAGLAKVQSGSSFSL
jgi:hypothetical protein